MNDYEVTLFDLRPRAVLAACLGVLLALLSGCKLLETTRKPDELAAKADAAADRLIAACLQAAYETKDACVLARGSDCTGTAHKVFDHCVAPMEYAQSKAEGYIDALEGADR